jgi:hypothetical protein
LKSSDLIVLIANGKLFLAISDKPIVCGFCFSVKRHPSLNLGAIFKKSYAVSF